MKDEAKINRSKSIELSWRWNGLKKLDESDYYVFFTFLNARACTHTNTYIHTYTHMPKHTHKHTHIHTNTQTLTRQYTHPITWTHTLIHIKHKQTHTHIKTTYNQKHSSSTHTHTHNTHASKNNICTLFFFCLLPKFYFELDLKLLSLTKSRTR